MTPCKCGSLAHVACSPFPSQPKPIGLLDDEYIAATDLRMEDDDEAPWYEVGELWCIALRRGREMTRRAFGGEYCGYHPSFVYGADSDVRTFIMERERGIPQEWGR